jgi:hypothetical protein
MKEPKKIDLSKCMTPNTAQRRPGLPKHSPPVKFIYGGADTDKEESM